MSDSDRKQARGSGADKASASSSRRRPPKPEKARPVDANPAWWAPTMVTLMVVGLVWLVVCYLTQTKYPAPGIGYWNLVIGFVAIIAGFMMTTRWR